jgi:nicotinamidase-related amidase
MASFRRKRNHDLDGSVPDSSPVVLMLVDVINDLDFPGNDALVKAAPRLGRRIAKLKARCHQAGIPTIYVNDNRGRWRSDFRDVVQRCLRPTSLGRSLVEQIVPQAHDYVVLKPKHSPFYATPLDVILTHLDARTIVLAGLTTNACILSSASGIHVRDFKLFVPGDCVAALNATLHRRALSVMEESFRAVTTPSSKLNLERVKRM